jgi:uncharacterized protein YqjF (DUF2071 family)
MTWSPTLEGRIERRLLVNYRVDPERIAALLPAPFRPEVVNGYAVAGVCLIRLGEIRPRGLPRRVGLRSENAAHRVAVQWDEDGETRRGVYIPRRETSSILSAAVGGRLFPGTYEHARFSVAESPPRFDVSFIASDGSVRAQTGVVLAGELNDSKIFSSVDAASAFFEHGSVAYSATRSERCLDGIELRTPAWRVEPARIEHARSSVFDDPAMFPPGTAEPDCALVMLDVPVEWHPLGRFGDSHARESRQEVLEGI